MSHFLYSVFRRPYSAVVFSTCSLAAISLSTEGKLASALCSRFSYTHLGVSIVSSYQDTGLKASVVIRLSLSPCGSG